jgi:hypothetical protein
MPGSLDSNLARSTVAARYQKELSVSCIVGNITRGISEANVRTWVIVTLEMFN